MSVFRDDLRMQELRDRMQAQRAREDAWEAHQKAERAKAAESRRRKTVRYSPTELHGIPT